MKNKSTDHEFPIVANDELEYPAGVLVMKPGMYGFIEFDMYDPTTTGELMVGGDVQQVGFVMSKQAALGLAAAIREFYGIKDTDDAGVQS